MARRRELPRNGPAGPAGGGSVLPYHVGPRPSDDRLLDRLVLVLVLVGLVVGVGDTVQRDVYAPR